MKILKIDNYKEVRESSYKKLREVEYCKVNNLLGVGQEVVDRFEDAMSVGITCPTTIDDLEDILKEFSLKEECKREVFGIMRDLIQFELVIRLYDWINPIPMYGSILKDINTGIFICKAYLTNN